MNVLEHIQSLQFRDKPAAEAILISFIRDTFGLDVQSVELRPLAVSLNSFNGFMTLEDGQRLFFKTHTEPSSVIGEYYHASALAEAGYPVLQPRYSSTESGKQFLIYDVISDPSVFDVAWGIENGDPTHREGLTRAQNAADDELWTIYLHTFEPQSAEDAAHAPVHQLFYHRLTGGRLDQFYGDGVHITLPGVGEISIRTVRSTHWAINGQVYDETLNDIIERAIRLLNPSQAGLSIVGHGDAHNGNVFYQSGNPPHMLYFDPAFAGRHSPLLDLTKPLFHNVFAMWMYFPREITAKLHISLDTKRSVWEVQHNYTVHSIRHMFLNSKVNRVLIPALREMRSREMLPLNWREILKASLFCCPFLTMNLSDAVKFPPEISLLGLCMAVEMGAESGEHRSIIDQTLDEVERAL